jgi:hypothetical protein
MASFPFTSCARQGAFTKEAAEIDRLTVPILSKPHQMENNRGGENRRVWPASQVSNRSKPELIFTMWSTALRRGQASKANKPAKIRCKTSCST